MGPKNTLFVCTANTCRSPMAATMMREELSRKFNKSWQELEDEGYYVDSAGLLGWKNRVITAGAIQMLNELGYQPPVGRMSRNLDEDLVTQTDQIYAMAAWQLKEVLAAIPQAKGKITLLAGSMDIDDPIFGDIEKYREVATQIQAHVLAIVGKY